MKKENSGSTDKLTRYNQKLLAIIGTAVLAIATISLLIGVGVALFSGLSKPDHRPTGIQVQENPVPTNDTSQTVKRTQEVTFNRPISLDTLGEQFLIPVGQVNLEAVEEIHRERLSDKISGSSFYYKKSGRSQHGLFNNFVYIDYAKGVKRKVFDRVVVCTKWTHYKLDTLEVLLFKGAATDHNQDGQMNESDYQSLFAFFPSDGKLKEFSFQHGTVEGYRLLEKTHLVSIMVGTDKNKDVYFDQTKEPQEVMTLDLATREIQPMVPVEMKEEIQRIVDGVK